MCRASIISPFSCAKNSSINHQVEYSSFMEGEAQDLGLFHEALKYNYASCLNPPTVLKKKWVGQNASSRHYHISAQYQVKQFIGDGISNFYSLTSNIQMYMELNSLPLIQIINKIMHKALLTRSLGHIYRGSSFLILNPLKSKMILFRNF